MKKIVKVILVISLWISIMNTGNAQSYLTQQQLTQTYSQIQVQNLPSIPDGWTYTFEWNITYLETNQRWRYYTSHPAKVIIHPWQGAYRVSCTIRMAKKSTGRWYGQYTIYKNFQT